MASKGIQDILGWVALTKAVNAVKDGVPNPFPPWLMTVAAENKIIGNSVKAGRLYGQRQVRPHRPVRRPAPPPRDQQEELNEFKFITFSEERTFDPYVLQTLRDYDSYDNARPRQAARRQQHQDARHPVRQRPPRVARDHARLRQRLRRQRRQPAPDQLRRGQHLRPQHPVGQHRHRHDDTNSNAGIFGATGQGSWLLNGTNIPQQLTTLEEVAAADHGYEPEVALYGKAVRGAMIQNDFVLDFLARNPTMQNEWLKDKTIPDGLFGFTWVPVNKASYTKDDGTKVKLWPTNGVTFLPGQADAPQVWTPFEGSNLIPTTIDIVPDAMAALSGLETVHGAAGYSVVSHKPVSLSVVMVDTFWWGIRVPEAIYIADVVA
jgi:hypothetical protein